MNPSKPRQRVAARLLALALALSAIAASQTVVSRPAVQPQPSTASYGWQVLSLFSQFDRQSFEKQFGVQPPAFDPARRIKTWFDSTVEHLPADAPVSYRILTQDRSGEWAFRTMTVSAAEARSVNLPGEVRYPAYTPAATRATRGGFPVNPDYLSTRAQADEIARLLGQGVVVDEGQTPVFAGEYPPGEDRRLWAISIAGVNHNVGILLKNQFARGIGYPGRWVLDGSEPKWIADPFPPTGLDDTRPPREIPVRDLLPNERLQPGIFGIAIARTDLAQPAEPSGFTAADRQMLREILELLRKR